MAEPTVTGLSESPPEYSMSKAPEWLVERVEQLSRLMSSSPRSVADGIWFELHQKIALEFKESMEFQNDAMVRQIQFQLVNKASDPVPVVNKDGSLPGRDFCLGPEQGGGL